MSKKVLFLSESTDGFVQEEASRSAVGTVLGGHEPSLFIINVEYDMERGDAGENLEWIRDSDGIVMSNNQANVDKSEHVEFMSLEDMAKKMVEFDFVIPY